MYDWRQHSAFLKCRHRFYDILLFQRTQTLRLPFAVLISEQLHSHTRLLRFTRSTQKTYLRQASRSVQISYSSNTIGSKRRRKKNKKKLSEKFLNQIKKNLSCLRSELSWIRLNKLVRFLEPFKRLATCGNHLTDRPSGSSFCFLKSNQPPIKT